MVAMQLNPTKPKYESHIWGRKLVVLFNPYLAMAGDKRVHTFPKGISPKVNVIARLEFELINYDVVV